MKYSEYITSNKWRILRIKALKYYGSVCAVCNETKNLHVHHIDYSNFGDEDLTDLRILCSLHHQELHFLHTKSLLSLKEFSLFYIKNSKLHNEVRKKEKNLKFNKVVSLEGLYSEEALLIHDLALRALELPKYKNVIKNCKI